MKTHIHTIVTRCMFCDQPVVSRFTDEAEEWAIIKQSACRVNPKKLLENVNWRRPKTIKTKDFCSIRDAAAGDGYRVTGMEPKTSKKIRLTFEDTQAELQKLIATSMLAGMKQAEAERKAKAGQ